MNFTLLTRVTKTCCNTIDGNVNKANFVIGQIIVTKTFNQFNLDVVQDIEVWQTEVQTCFKAMDSHQGSHHVFQWQE